MQRHILKYLLPVASVITAAATGCGPDFAGNYKIDLIRAREVGDRFLLTAKGEWHDNMDAKRGDRVEDSTFSFTNIHIEAQGEVLEVDGSGLPTRVRFTIRRYEAAQETGNSTSLERGSTLIASVQLPHLDFGVYSDNISENEEQLLKVLLAPRGSDGALLWQCLTPQSRKQVGDTWMAQNPFDASLEPFGDMHLFLEGVTGEVKLTGTPEVSGAKCIRLHAELNLPNVYIEKSNLPRFSSRTGSRAWWNYTCDLPLNRDWGVMHERSRLRMDVYLDLRRGRVDGTMQRLLTMERAYQYQQGGS